MKQCSRCGQIKEYDQFYKRPSSKDGLYGHCKSCQNDYAKLHYDENKKYYSDKARRNENKYKKQYYDWLSTQKCVDCGNSDIRVLQQDHITDKKFNVATKIGSQTFSSLLAELAKCEVVCANCHSIRTAERSDWFKTQYGPVYPHATNVLKG